MTYKEARLLTIGTVVFDNTRKNADGTSHRWRVTGMCKVWKRYPGKFHIPIKRGMYEYYEINELNHNMLSLQEENDG